MGRKAQSSSAWSFPDGQRGIVQQPEALPHTVMQQVRKVICYRERLHARSHCPDNFECVLNSEIPAPFLGALRLRENNFSLGLSVLQ